MNTGSLVLSQLPGKKAKDLYHLLLVAGWLVGLFVEGRKQKAKSAFVRGDRDRRPKAE